MSSYLLAGLGNPGPKYELTRHNIGFLVIDRFVDRLGIALTQQKFHGRYASGICRGEKVHLLQSQTFMNLSGKSVASARSFFDIEMPNVIVVHDELDLPFGVVRIKIGGGHGGHNGLRDIIAQTGQNDFIRVRMGIGRPEKGSVTDWVLSPFPAADTDELLIELDTACDALEAILADGASAAQNQFNGR